tara:strand:- start:4030 stop:4467 length:438 start_codon:yes stop_codon:yes gene_type:complete
MAYSGKFRPTKPRKYKGDPTNIVFRSLWELKFMKYCDTNKNIIKWASEEHVIRYKSPIDEKYHRYYPDFYIKYIDNNGKTLESIIEIKPLKQVNPPKQQKRRTKKYVAEVYEYAKNQAKWEAATEYCKDRRWDFKVLTEKELGIN